MRLVQNARLLALILITGWTPFVQAKFHFRDCKAKILKIQNGTQPDIELLDALFVDRIKTNNPEWFYKDWPRGLIKSPDVQKPLMLTKAGCYDICGAVPEFNTADDAFQILTTWVLPMIALFSNLPFESLNKRKVRSTLEALVNWIGSPQSAFTTTMFNIFQIRNCQRSVQPGDMRQHYVDSFFILGCINQYYYARYRTRIPQGMDINMPAVLAPIEMSPTAAVGETVGSRADRLERTRNRALFYGLFRPLSVSGGGLISRAPEMPGDVLETRYLLKSLAFQLRMLRRRGVYPMMFSMFWFVIAFAIALVLSFGSLGDNTTAHSLALGLGLVWLPALVFMTIVDRNPVSPTRCRVLIERWLYNVNAIIEYESTMKGTDENATPQEICWWSPERDEKGNEITPIELEINEFVGQGRRMRHCGVANTVFEHLQRKGDKQWFYNDKLARYTDFATNFEDDIIKRPFSWWVCWACGGAFVSISIWMAMMVSFNTPTIGLGCRSLSWFMFWILSSVSWVFQAWRQEPPKWMRRLSVAVNSLSFILLLSIMFLQTINGMDSCLCRSVIFGTKSYGGYMDFEEAAFYKRAYHVVTWWAVGAAIGPLGGILPILWTLRRWARSSELWKVEEDPVSRATPLARPEEGGARRWRDGTSPVDWLNS